MNRDMGLAKQIVKEECFRAGVSEVELLIAPKTRTWSWIRRVIIVRLREETNLSFREIGTMVGRSSGVQKQYQRAVAPVANKKV